MRAQGMPGARCTRSLACKNKKAHEVVTTGSPEQPGIPRAMVLTVSFALSPVTGLYCHCRRQVTTCQLDASVGASEPHDFAVRVSTFRQACFSVHRIPCPTSVTIAKRPSRVGRDGGSYGFDLGRTRREIFLRSALDSGLPDLPVRQSGGA